MEIEVTILKFENLSKRKDVKRPTWFAAENDILSHPDFFKIDAEEFRCWYWIMSVATRLNSETVRLSPELFAFQCRSNEAVFYSTLDKLKDKRLSFQQLPAHVTRTSQIRHTHVTLHTDKDVRTEQYMTEHNNTKQDIYIAKSSPDKESGQMHPLIELWNLYSGSLSKVKKTNAIRNKKCKAIFSSLTKEEWTEVIVRISKSDFCQGKNNTGWAATFDFLIRPDTHLKVMEGKYDNRNSNHGKTDNGLYLTNAVKRSYNNKAMIEKYLKGGIDETGEQLKDVGADLLDSRMSRDGDVRSESGNDGK